VACIEVVGGGRVDAFVDKVKAPADRPMRVVSLRSMDTVDQLRLRAAHRYVLRQRDDLLRGLGETALEMLGGDGLDEVKLRERADAIRALDAQITTLERRLEKAQQAQRMTAVNRPAYSFLTVCACGAPLYPDDVRCSVCGSDVEKLISVARESKAAHKTAQCTCGFTLVEGIKFCPECGRSVIELMRSRGLQTAEARCASCGEAASPGDRFCSGCGAALTSGG